MKKNGDHVYVVTGILVGVSGFEPEASWTRTKRDTKLRHTPIAQILELEFMLLSSVCAKMKTMYEIICGTYND